MTILRVISLPSCCLFAFWLLSDPSVGLVKTVLAVCLFVCMCVCVCQICIGFEPLWSWCTWALWPFVPHNLISAWESPVPLPKFQMASRFKILTFSGSKKETQIYYHFHSKSPSKQIPFRFPNGTPIERDTHLQGIFTSLLVYFFLSLPQSPC